MLPLCLHVYWKCLLQLEHSTQLISLAGGRTRTDVCQPANTLHGLYAALNRHTAVYTACNRCTAAAVARGTHSWLLALIFF